MNMRIFAKTALSAMSVASLAAFAGPLDKAWLKGTTGKNPLFYEAGETMTFTVAPQRIEGEIPEGAYFLSWKRTGDDGVKEEGKIPFDGKPFTYSTSIGKPGFVRLFAEVVDAEGKKYKKKYTGDTTTPEGLKAANEFEKAGHGVFFDGGAGVGIDTLAARPEPADFDAFWARQREKLAKVPVKADVVEVPCDAEQVRMFAVSVDCAGPRPVTGYMTVPKAAYDGAKFPCRLVMFGYGFYRQSRPGVDNAKEVVFSINAHGMKLPEAGADDGYYKKLESSIKSNGQIYAFDPVQNKDPETAYFNGMALRVMRALQYLKTLEWWDGEHLIACGGSQGGLQTMWAAGCGEGVTYANSSITWCCDLGGELEGRNRGNWYIRWSDGLGYYDPVNFAKRVPATCTVEIPRAGLGDYVCPPSGLAMLWNALKCPKKIVWVQGSQHGYVPPKYEGRDFVRTSGM